MCLPTFPKFGVRGKEIQTVCTFPENARTEPLLLHPLISTQCDLTFPHIEEEWMSKGGGPLRKLSEHPFIHTLPLPAHAKLAAAKLLQRELVWGCYKKQVTSFQLTSPRIWLVNRHAAWLSTLSPSCLLAHTCTLIPQLVFPFFHPLVHSTLSFQSQALALKFSPLSEGYSQEIIIFCVLCISSLV